MPGRVPKQVAARATERASEVTPTSSALDTVDRRIIELLRVGQQVREDAGVALRPCAVIELLRVRQQVPPPAHLLRRQIARVVPDAGFAVGVELGRTEALRPTAPSP